MNGHSITPRIDFTNFTDCAREHGAFQFVVTFADKASGAQWLLVNLAINFNWRNHCARFGLSSLAIALLSHASIKNHFLNQSCMSKCTLARCILNVEKTYTAQQGRRGIYLAHAGFATIEKGNSFSMGLS